MEDLKDWLLFISVLSCISGCLFLYIAPTLVGRQRKKANLAGICALNVLLGWTLVGWVLALAWALTVDRKRAMA